MQYEELEFKIDEISKRIKDMGERKKLLDLSKKLESDKEVIKLSYLFQKAQEEYDFIVAHFKEDSAEVKKAQLDLFHAKEKLDFHPLVKEYNECFLKVNEPLRYLELNLIYKLRSKN